MLHFARRVERTLLSYERVGWSEEPAITIEGFETRPAAECGPIIVCLDTSGSMMGARETVAKAMVLECMRQSRSQQRACYLYSFSGPGDCQELELKLNATGLQGLLEFLSGSFHGGTDVDEPFNRALVRLSEAEWQNSDILLVTDGEIAPPNEELIANLNEAKEEMGLKCTDCSSARRATRTSSRAYVRTCTRFNRGPPSAVVCKRTITVDIRAFTFPASPSANASRPVPSRPVRPFASVESHQTTPIVRRAMHALARARNAGTRAPDSFRVALERGLSRAPSRARLARRERRRATCVDLETVERRYLLVGGIDGGARVYDTERRGSDERCDGAPEPSGSGATLVCEIVGGGARPAGGRARRERRGDARGDDER